MAHHHWHLWLKISWNRIYIFHSLRGDMVDCHPEETLLTEAEPRSTTIFEGWRSTISSRQECNIYFIPIVPISYTTSTLLYQITKRTRRRFQWILPVTIPLLKYDATADIAFSIRTVCAYISRSRHFLIREKGRDLTQSCDKNPYTHRTIQKATWQHKNATKKFDYTTIADRLRTVSWSNSSHPTGMVKPVYERSTFPLTAKVV